MTWSDETVGLLIALIFDGLLIGFVVGYMIGAR